MTMTLEEVRDGLNLLVVGTVFASFLIPTSVVLFTFSPFAIWGTPLFILNVLAIILGLIEQGLYIYVIINTTVIVGLPTSLIILIVTMEFLVPICVEGILLIRLVAAYPPASNTRRQNLAIYIPVIAFKIARLANVLVATHNSIAHLSDSLGVIVAAQFVWRTEYVKIEWFLQLFDDMFVSGLFVYKLYPSVTMRRGISTSHSSVGPSYSWATRIRMLYYIALSNFVFPIVFNIAEIAIIFYDDNFLHGAMVVTVNCYLTVIGVMLATIWAQGSKRGELHPDGRSRHCRNVTMPNCLKSASCHAEEDEADSEDRDFHDSRSQKGKEASLKRHSTGGRAGDAPSTWTWTPGKEESVFFQNVRGGSAVITQSAIYEKAEAGEKRVSEFSSWSSSKSITTPGRGPEAELHSTAGDDEKTPSVHRDSAAASPTSVCERESTCRDDVADDPISFAV